MHGEEGDSGERQLKKSETHTNKFERNQVKKQLLLSKYDFKYLANYHLKIARL